MELIYDNKVCLLKVAYGSDNKVALVSEHRYSILLVDMRKPG